MPQFPGLELVIVSNYPSIHPFSIPAEAYPSCHWARGGFQPGQVASPSQGHTETKETNNHTHAHTHSRTILESPIILTWTVGGSRSTRREPTHTRGEHANSTQKGPSLELNLEPSRCEC